MYRAHFGLRDNPFGTTPAPEFIYQSPEHQEALAHFRYAMANREAFVLLTGEVGTGKTTAVQALRRELPEGTPVAVVTHTTLAPSEFLEEILIRFGLESKAEESRPARVRRLERFLEQQLLNGGQALLFIDEAHLLNEAVLEEVRLLSNLEQDGWKLVQICLVGQPELEAHLQKPELRQLRQRISVRYTLKPLTPDQTREYIYHRLTAAGAGNPARMFPADAARAVHDITHGIPREINVVAGQAMLNAFLEEAPAVTRAHVFSVKTDYGFEGIVTGRQTRSTPTPPVPSQLPTAAAPPPPTVPAPPPATPGSAGRGQTPPPPAPPPPTSTAPPASPPPTAAAGPPPTVPQAAARQARRPIPLPPASLRPPPAARKAASSPAPQPESPRGARPEAKPAEALPPTPPPRAAASKSAAGSPSRRQPSRWGGVRRGLLYAVIVAALLLLVAGGVWWSGWLDTAATGNGTPAASSPDAQTASPPQGLDAAADGNTSAGSVGEASTETPPATVNGDGSATKLAIQVASFRTRRHADRVLARLERSTGLQGVVLAASVQGVIWHRIMLGEFDTEAEATAAAGPLVRDNTINQIVVRPLPVGDATGDS